LHGAYPHYALNGEALSADFLCDLCDIGMQFCPGDPVWHEDIVDDLEGSVRRMLEFCGLELERACLEFYQSDRSIVTASSEQVRHPIFREGLNQWKNYEPWLNSLKDHLGDALVGYRE
jgi:hypothetical protein